MKITKAIIPAAGLGTRFLPFTKAVPKELLPILSKPAIQYIVEEAAASGINNICVVTSTYKQSLADFLTPNSYLASLIKKRKKYELLEDTEKLLGSVTFSYIEQPDPLGLGHAIDLARAFANEDYVSVLLPDDIIMHDTPCISQLMQVACTHKATVIAVREVATHELSAYGVIKVKRAHSDTLFEVEQLVEKPHPDDAPSNLAIIGRYVLSPEAFRALHRVPPHANGEIQLTDGLDLVTKEGHPVFAVKVSGQRFDTGTPLGWLEANLAYALKDPEYAPLIKGTCSRIAGK